MGIARNAANFGNRIDAPGEYKVRVKKMETRLTKESQKPMLVVTFETDDEKVIDGFYVKDLKFHMVNLKELKLACGLKADASHELLLGKELGILVDRQKPQDDGTVFMQIAGYGKASDVSVPPPTSFAGSDSGSGMIGDDSSIPF